MYFYLLKRKSNGVLTEYARKRDSCSFLISNLILEEYSNDFYIYSSNKYGTNRDRSVKLTIVNHEFAHKNGLGSGDGWDGENGSRSSRQLAYMVSTAFVFVLVFLIVCCLLMRCKRGADKYEKSRYSAPTGVIHHGDAYPSHMQFQQQHYASNGSMQRRGVDPYKYYNTNGSHNGSLKHNGHFPADETIMNGKIKIKYKNFNSIFTIF